MIRGNENQVRAIEARAPRITVDASAGTGKTWVLTQRYFSFLLNDGNVPNDILTLTFTQTAASDMKKRIQARFSDSIMLSQSWISTIHAFASRLLRQSGLSLDIDPAASVISPRQQSDFWQSVRLALSYSNLHSLSFSCKDKILNETADYLDKNEMLSSAVNKWTAQKLTDLAEKFSDLHASRGLTWEEMLKYSEDDELVKRAKIPVEKILSQEWERVFNEWSKVDNLFVVKTMKPGSGGLLFLELLSRRDELSPKDFYKEIVMNRAIKSNNGEPFKALKEILGMTLAEWRKQQSKIIQDITSNFDEEPIKQELELRKVLIKFCALCWGIWDITKQKRGLLSFSDMILHALRAVNEGAVTKNFAHILVDEFQDTDPLQYKMIKALAAQTENNSLFAVGDPKQSIYRFRHAEPELFAQAIREASVEVNLNVSFRTRPSLLERINKIFGSIWKHSLGSSEAMSKLNYKPLKPAEISSERSDGSMKDFEVILQIQDDSEAVKNLALKLADKIKRCVDEKRTIWDKERQIIRELKYSDVAVLCRSRTHYESLEQAFSLMGIKTIQDRSTGYFGRGEVSDIISMLKACADLEDDASVAGWLMSPFSGATEEEALKCLRIKSEEKNSHIIEIIKSEIPEVFKNLEYLALTGEVKGPAAVIEVFDKNRSWLNEYKFENRLRVIRNLRKSISIAMNFQEGGVTGLSACSEWLGRAMTGGVTLDEPSWHDKNENAVLLSTIHGSKGLEYPVAVIFETVTKNSKSSGLRESRDLGLVFSDLPDELKTNISDVKKELQFSNWDKLLNIQGEQEESMRLFYVAMTRAQDSIIFCSLLKKNGEAFDNSWTKILYENVPEYMPDIRAITLDVKPEGSLKIPKKNEVNSEKILKQIEFKNHNKTLRQISASSFSLYEFCDYAWRRKYQQGINLTWESPEKDFINDDNEEFFGGADLGSLAHWILSKINSRDELDKFLNERETLNILPVKLRGIWRDNNAKKILSEWLNKFLDSNEGMKIISGNVKREASFRIKLNEIILAGSIDAVYKDGDYYKLLDYKTTLSDNAPEGLYESQLDFYAFAMKAQVKNAKIKSGTYFLREGKYFERNYNEADYENIKIRILKAAKDCLINNVKKENRKCERCPFKKGCKKCSVK